MAADWRQERIAKNETSFRSINERLRRGLDQVPERPDVHEFVCECGSRDCTEMVSLALDEYEAVRASPKLFAVRPGHVYPDVERVLEEHERYVVIEKLGDTRRIAEETDPRS